MIEKEVNGYGGGGIKRNLLVGINANDGGVTGQLITPIYLLLTYKHERIDCI
jgi:hypothetical protein